MNSDELDGVDTRAHVPTEIYLSCFLNFFANANTAPIAIGQPNLSSLERTFRFREGISYESYLFHTQHLSERNTHGSSEELIDMQYKA